MAKLYERVNWEDLPSKNTPINAENLNKMDKAIDDLDDKIVELEESSSSGDDYLTKANPTGTGSFSMNRKANTTVGNYSHAEGYNTTASGDYSHAEGYNTTASGDYSHAEGYYTGTNSSYAHAEGYETHASYIAHAEGDNTTASGDCSHAEGEKSRATGECSHAEGYYTAASGEYSHAEGNDTKATYNSCHAEGSNTTASGSSSHAEGSGATASGYAAHAENCVTTASGDYSHAEGYWTIAKGESQHVQGKYNVEDTTNTYAHIVGGGTSKTDRKNIHTLDWEGNAEFAGDVSNGNGVTLDGLKELVEEKTNIDDATPTYTEAEELAELTSGEKLSTAFGKLAKAVKDLISHLADKVVHITSDERTLWNTVSNKADSNHTHNYAGSSSAGGAANSAKTLYHTRYIDGIPFDGSSNLSRLGTCTTATYMADKEVAISAFDDEGGQDAILYIQFTATYEGALNDAHAISINGGEPLTIYYKGEVFNWETYFSNYPFCDGQIHQFRYFWTPMGSYLELIAPQNRAVANNLTTTNEKIALAAPMGKQLAETDASLQEQISTLNSNISPMSFKKVKNFVLNANGGTCTISSLLGQYILTSNQGAAIGDAAGMSFITITTNSAGCIAFILCGGERYKQINVSVTAGSLILTNPNNCDIYMNLYKI